MPTHRRLNAVDQARGTAVLAMVAFHVLFDLRYYTGVQALKSSGPVPTWFWDAAPILIGGSFLTISGLSSWLKFSRSTERKWLILLPNALRVLAAALLVTSVSFTVFEKQRVLFGILHCIGVSTLLIYPFLTLSIPKALILGIPMIVGGLYLQDFIPGILMPLLGFGSSGKIQLIDHYPLFPWFGLFLGGTIFGRWFYPIETSSSSNNAAEVLAPTRAGAFVAFLGKHSLVIYLIHQPLILAIFYSLGLIAKRV